MEREFGWTRTEVSAAFSVSLVVSGIVAIPIGRLLDRRAPRGVLTAGGVAAVAAMLGWASIDSLGQLYAVFALLGVAMGLLLYQPAFTVLAKWFAPSPRRALTILTVFGGLAGLIFTPLTTWFLELWGWRGACLALALVALFAILVPLGGLLPSSQRDGGAPAAADSTPRRALGGLPFWSLTLALFLGYFIVIAMVVHFVPYLLERGFSVGFAALAAGLVGGMQVAGRALMLPLQRRLPRAWVTVGVFAVQGLALLFLPAAHSELAILLFVVCFGAARGLVPLVQATLVSDLYGAGYYGELSGVIACFAAFAQAVAPLSVGALHDAAGGYGPMVWILVAAAATAATAAYVTERQAHALEAALPA
jgi:predicted MFS family arabinose efflux permease